MVSGELGRVGGCLNWTDACGKGMFTGKTERRFYGKEGREMCERALAVAMVVMECRRMGYGCECRCETGVK